MKQELYTGIIIAVIIILIITVSIIKKIKWLIFIAALSLLAISIRTGILWLALGYEEPPNIEVKEIETPELGIKLPKLPVIEYEIDESRIGFGLDGIIDK